MARGSIIERTRKNQKGEKVGTGHYAVIVSYNDADGKRKQIWKSAPSMRQAEKLRTKLLSTVDNGMFSNYNGTLREFLVRWLTQYVTPTLSPTTAETYAKMVNSHIIPALGSIKLIDLKPEHLQRFYAKEIKSGLSTTTVRHFHMILHKALDHALKWGLVTRNVVDAVDSPKNARTEMRILSAEEINLVMKEAKATPYHALFMTALMTGMRRSELLGLRWSDINLPLAEISVSRSLHQLTAKRETIYRPTKTAKSKRTIALSPNTCQLLSDHLDTEIEQCSGLGLKFKSDRPVFAQFDGKPLRPDSISQLWLRITRKCGLTGIHLHSLRHTHASILLGQNVHPKIVQERLGHSNITTTLDTYSHVTPGLQRAAASKLDTFLENDVSKPLATMIYVK